MKLTPQELIETINAAVAAATKETLGTKFPENVFNIHHSLAAKIMAELAAAGYPTPEETYGFDIEWAVKDICAAYHATVGNLNAARKDIDQITDDLQQCDLARAAAQDRIQELEAAQKPQEQPVTQAA